MGLLDKYLGEIAAVLIAALAIFCGYLEVELANAHAETDRVEAQSAKDKGAAEKAARVAGDEYRAIEEQLTARTTEASDARQKIVELSARIAAGFRDDSPRVRTAIAAYAAPSRSASAPDTAAACRERASTLGDVLAGSLRTEEDLTDALERSGADTRSLLDAWPVTRTPQPPQEQTQ